MLTIERMYWLRIQEENGRSADSERFLLLTDLNEIFIEYMKETRGTSCHFQLDMQPLLSRLSDMQNIPLETKLCIMKDMLMLLGQQGQVGIMKVSEN